MRKQIACVASVVVESLEELNISYKVMFDCLPGNSPNPDSLGLVQRTTECLTVCDAGD